MCGRARKSEEGRDVYNHHQEKQFMFLGYKKESNPCNHHQQPSTKHKREKKKQQTKATRGAAINKCYMSFFCVGAQRKWD
jgi:hypothetical protein